MNSFKDIRLARESKGLSQSEVAKRVGVTASMVTKWETDDEPIRPQYARRIAALLGLDEKKFMMSALEDYIRHKGISIGILEGMKLEYEGFPECEAYIDRQLDYVRSGGRIKEEAANYSITNAIRVPVFDSIKSMSPVSYEYMPGNYRQGTIIAYKVQGGYVNDKGNDIVFIDCSKDSNDGDMCIIEKNNVGLFGIIKFTDRGSFIFLYGTNEPILLSDLDRIVGKVIRIVEDHNEI